MNFSVNLDAAVKVRTNVRLLEVDIDADCVCYNNVVPVIPKPVRPLHLVFLVDTSDSFNKLELCDSGAGEIIIEKFVADFLRSGKHRTRMMKLLTRVLLGKFSNRSQPTTTTVIQFSGIGPDTKYIPGTGGRVPNTELYHYKVELGPLNLSTASARDSINMIKQNPSYRCN